MDADRLARWYRAVEYAAFGRALERCRFAFLDRLAGAKRVLLIGEGDGRVLERLLAIAPEAAFEVIDCSRRMLALARARAGDQAGRVCYRREDVRQASLDAAQYDAVATFFRLDCFSAGDAERVMNSIERALAPGGVWLHGDFAIPAHGWRRYHAAAWIRVMYRFFATTTGLTIRRLPAIPALFAAARMRRVASQTQRWGLVVSEVFEKPLR